MSDRNEGRRTGGDEDDRGPGGVYNMYEVMSDLIEKLKLMHYEENFCKPNAIKPFNRHYFALSTNPGEQFHSFTCLSAWLLNSAGINFEMPQEYDDPNATINNILEELKRFGVPVNFAPSRLKTGSGEFVCYVVDRLAEEALKNTGFQWLSPVYPEESPDDDLIQEDEDIELPTGDVVDDPGFIDSASDGGDDPLLVIDSTHGDKDHKDTVLQSNTNAEDWKLEVERVAPSLKVTIRTDNKDWRTHVDQMKNYKHGIESSLSEAKSQLDKLQDEITRTLEKIGSREKYINNQLEHLVGEYRGVQDGLAQAKEKYKQASGGVTQHSRSLAELTDSLEKVKLEMEDRGSSMTDGAPLVRIKQALNRLKNESTQMNIRTGVIEHILNQAALRDKSIMHNDMNRQPATEDGSFPSMYGGTY